MYFGRGTQVLSSNENSLYSKSFFLIYNLTWNEEAYPCIHCFIGIYAGFMSKLFAILQAQLVGYLFGIFF